MRTLLYDLSVPTFLQTVRSVGGFLDRAATHFSNTAVDPNNFVNTRLVPGLAFAVSATTPYPPRPLLSQPRPFYGTRRHTSPRRAAHPPHIELMRFENGVVTPRLVIGAPVSSGNR